MEEGFERPYVEKYRPETLEDVVGKKTLINPFPRQQVRH